MQSLSELARGIFTQAIHDCSIERSFDRVVSVASMLGTPHLSIGSEEVFALNHLKHLRVVAAGKAAAPMLDALLSRLPIPASYDVQGILIAPQRPRALAAGIDFYAGGHPLPTQESFAGAAAALSMLQDAGRASAAAQDTLCIFLVSGGASAMMELPLDPAISLEDTLAFYQALVHSGASIVEVNCVRKHFSAVKGGRLALAAGAATCISLLVSDVPPAHLDALASGPSLPDPTTLAQCREIIARHHLVERFPASVSRFFESEDLAETPKPNEMAAHVCKLLDGDDLAEAARSYAARLGFDAVIDNTCDDWSYEAAADYLLNRLRELRRQHPRLCLVSVGEVTVQLPPKFAQTGASSQSATQHAPARGGRNQHLALYLATRLRASDGPIAVLSAGSDGIDGNSEAAGAVVDQNTASDDRSRKQALRALADFDSSTWLTSMGATVVAGPTGHNLRDLRILLTDHVQIV
jgi:glycerate 2-kinase